MTPTTRTQVGTGVQILVAGTATLVLAALGFLSPAARGALLTAGIIIFVLLAGLAGFVSCYVWGLMERTFNGWQGVAARVAVYYPAINMVGRGRARNGPSGVAGDWVLRRKAL